MSRRGLILLMVFKIFSAYSQQTASEDKETRLKELSEQVFNEEVYGGSIILQQAMADLPALPQFQFPPRDVADKQLNAAISALRLGTLYGENDLKNFILEHYNLPEISAGILELASYYYNNRNYKEAILWYDRIEDPFTLSEIEMSELSFKKGYSYFISKEFKAAKKEFERSKELRNAYFHNLNYYYGICQYLDKEYVGSIESFKRAANSDVYASHVPYYITQIYFITKDYDKLISYAEQKITDKKIYNTKEIRQLLGQTYYLRNDFDRALPHLEFYENNTEKLTAEEFYQLGFTQYKLGRFLDAKSNFLELTNIDSKMGQLSNYYLADCLIKLEDKTSARAAFKKVAQFDYDAIMKAEATFNYGKISAELGYDREAINVLIDIDEKSRYHKESQDIINDVLVNSGDYIYSLTIIESLPKLNDKIKATYQQLALKQSIQYFSDGNTKDALTYLEKALLHKMDRNYTSQALYWKSQIKNDSGQYEESMSILDQYFETSNGLNDLPEESSQFMAHYVQGYNYLKIRNYSKAELEFKNCIVGININREEIRNDVMLNRILPDAFIRTGDCLFKQKSYNNAKTFYDQAISRKQGGYVYALYQRGLIEGLTGDNNAKIETMLDIVKNHSNSEYADDAHVQLGDTYLAMGDGEKAAFYFIDLIAKFGKKSEFYNVGQLKLGLINYNRGEINKALDYYKSVVNSDPSPKERNEALKSIQEIYIDELSNAAGYLSYLDSVPGLSINDLSRDSLTYHLAISIFNNAQYDKAVEAFSDYLNKYALGYYKNDARYYRAESQNVLKQYNKSLNDYENILADGEGKYYQKSLYKAALISYNYTQNFEKALKYYKHYETFATDVGELFESQFGALKSAFKISKEDDIITYGEKVVKNDAASKEERSSAYYYLGKTYFKQNKLTQALEDFEKVDELSNNNQAAESRYLISEIYFKQNNLAKAEAQCQHTNERSSNYPYWIAKSLLLMSDIFIAKNDLLNARAAIEAVIENYKDDAGISKLANEKLDQLKIREANSNRIKSGSGQVEIINPKGN